MKNRPELILIIMAVLVFLMLIIGVIQNADETRLPAATSSVGHKNSVFSAGDIEVSALPERAPVMDVDWLNSLPEPDGMGKQERCLAEALYFEARGESVAGQIAVAEVILNRARSDRFPDTICDVVYQGSQRRNACQFSYACDGAPEVFPEKTAHASAKRLAAHLVESGRIGIAKGAQFYHAVTVAPSWADRLRQVAKIGDHVFLRYPDDSKTVQAGSE